MLKVDEIAKKLDISRGTVVNLIKKGKLGAIKIGDQYRIPDDVYQRYISTATLSTMKPNVDSKDLK